MRVVPFEMLGPFPDECVIRRRDGDYREIILLKRAGEQAYEIDGYVRMWFR